jgi:CRP-like cAMP-binding protein
MSIRFGSESIEVGLVGPGDLVNIGAMLGTNQVMHTVVAITDGSAVRIDSVCLRQLCRSHPELQAKVARYLQARLNQTMAFAACHALHSIEQRLASWVLVATDLLNTNEIRVTHLQLAKQLGVQRTSVTAALEALEGQRAIRSRRGRLMVRDRCKIGELACNCLAMPHRLRVPGIEVEMSATRPT